MSEITALVPIYGSNRLHAAKVGELLKGCAWCGIPFAGGMCEVPHIRARTIVANDLHRGIIALAGIVARSKGSSWVLQKELQGQLFHPDTLRDAQHRLFSPGLAGQVTERDEFQEAVDYFTVAWMTRSGSAGTPAERTGKLALRWEVGGGDSAKRYHSAIDALPEWCKEFQRCTFCCLDVFEFLDKCKDRERHGIYCDPPFFGACGKKYTHNCGDTEEEQLQWHEKLADRLSGFCKSRIVVRAYDVEAIRDLYPESVWTWHKFDGRKQTNDSAPEVLIAR